MLFQIGIDRTLTPQPRKRSLSLFTQMNFWQTILASLSWSDRERVRVRASDFDLHQLTSRTNPHIHATCAHQLSLGSRVTRKHFQNRDKTFIRKIRILPTHQTANITTRQPGAPGQLSLVQAALLCLPLQCHSQITHRFFLLTVLHSMQQLIFRNFNLRVPLSPLRLCGYNFPSLSSLRASAVKEFSPHFFAIHFFA
jgi:hypothetical protein